MGGQKVGGEIFYTSQQARAPSGTALRDYLLQFLHTLLLRDVGLPDQSRDLLGHAAWPPFPLPP